MLLILSKSQIKYLWKYFFHYLIDCEKRLMKKTYMWSNNVTVNSSISTFFIMMTGSLTYFLKESSYACFVENPKNVTLKVEVTLTKIINIITKKVLYLTFNSKAGCSIANHFPKIFLFNYK